MLTSSHSLPNLHAASRAHELSVSDNGSEKKCNPPNSSIFAYNTSAAILSKVDDVAYRLAQEPPCSLSGSALELPSLALVKDKDWPADVALVWKHDADTIPYTAFVPSDEKCWSDVEKSSRVQKNKVLRYATTATITTLQQNPEQHGKPAATMHFFK